MTLPWLRQIWLPLLAAMVSTLFASSAQAQSPWKTECKVDKMTEKTRCALSGQATDTVTLEPITVNFENNTLTLSGSGPLRRARLRVDGGNAIVMTQCVAQSCFVPGNLTSSVLRQLRTGSMVLVEVTQTDGKTIGPMDLPLGGFEAGIQQIR